jgi:hypothetical protein
MQNTLLHYWKSKQVREYILGSLIDRPLRKHTALIHDCMDVYELFNIHGSEKTSVPTSDGQTSQK